MAALGNVIPDELRDSSFLARQLGLDRILARVNGLGFVQALTLLLDLFGFLCHRAVVQVGRSGAIPVCEAVQ